MISQDAAESDFIDGEIEKKNYRQRWTRNVQKLPEHPFNHGIHMDTHHLISAEAVKLSKLGKVLKRKGFDINDLNNLVGFPGTLPGACQLKTQLHRGDHIFEPPGEESYHDYVSGKIEKLSESIKQCYGKKNKRERDHEIHQLLNPIAVKVLKKINKFSLPLTDIYKNFRPHSGMGCGNCHNVTEARFEATPCHKKREHFKTPNQDGIDYRYQLSTARGNKKTITYQGTWTPKVTQ